MKFGTEVHTASYESHLTLLCTNQLTVASLYGPVKITINFSFQIPSRYKIFARDLQYRYTNSEKVWSDMFPHLINL